MAICESRLDTWSNRGAITNAQNSKDRVINVLESWAHWPADLNAKSKLQGSYRNSTNIRADSDVDFAYVLTSVFNYNVDKLNTQEKDKFNNSYADATGYDFTNYRNDVYQALIDTFGTGNVKKGNKAFKVTTSILPVDVLPARDYRIYQSFNENNKTDYIKAINFLDESKNKFEISYPGLHYNNGCIKQSVTTNRFKPFVRILKNARHHMVNNGLITQENAPSYFLECVAYNLPNHLFNVELQQTMLSFLQWMQNIFQSEKQSELFCQHEQHSLFGNDSRQWPSSDANIYLNSLIDVWNSGLN